MSQNNPPKIDLKEAIDKVNQVGNQLAGAFCDLASPIINDITASIHTSNLTSNLNTNSTSTTSTTFNSNTSNTNLNFTPNFKTKETTTNIFYLIFIPGVDKKDIELKILESNIVLKADTKMLSDTHWSNDSFQERHYRIKFKVPTGTKNDDLFVEYQNGVLKIVVTKNTHQESSENIVIN
tara:strand:- start:127 stop:666 length:540 start_codon:yes stop_codon:yes gene_type:complete